MKKEKTWEQSLNDFKISAKELEKILIRNAEKVEKKNQELQLLNEQLNLLRGIDILLAKKSFNLNEVIKEIVVGAITLIGAEYGDLLLPEDSSHIKIVWSTRANLIGIKIPIKGSRTGKAIMSGQSQLLNKIKPRSLYHKILPDMNSELAVPLKLENEEILGVINIESSKLNAFTRQHQALVEILAGQAAIAFRNSKVFDELKTINEMQSYLVSESGTLQKTLEFIGKRARALIGAEGCQVLRREGDELIIDYSTGMEPIGTRVLVSDSVSGMAVLSGKSINISDISKHSLAKKLYKNVLGDMKSEFVIPLKAGKEVLGVINFESPQIGAFKGREYLIKHFADLASMAIVNAKRIENLFFSQQKQSELYTMARIGDIAGNLIHDFNSEVGAIKTLIGEIKFKENLLLKSNPFLKDRLTDIEIMANKALKHPQDLKFSIERANKSSDIDINYLVEETLEGMDKPKNVKIDLSNLNRSVDKVYLVLIFKDVLRNIIKNAFEAMQNGGTLKIETRPWKIERSIKKPTVGIEIVISDTGPGIPKEKLEKIFEISETKGKRGLGFGLWWVNQFIKSIEGDILVKSEINQGTTFYLRIPFKTKQLPNI